MFSDELIDRIKLELGVQPTLSQLDVVKQLVDFTVTAKGNEAFILSGYAGTGKTTVVSALVRALKSINVKTVLLAPTGRAAKVFSAYSKHPAYTIHKKIYRQKSSKDGFGRFDIDKNLHTRTFFLVDEASMITNEYSTRSAFGTGAVLDDLFTYINNDKNCNLIFIGDSAQLPPVGVIESPALQTKSISPLASNVRKEVLTQVVRQTDTSGILHNATFIREKIENEDVTLPLFDLREYADIISLSGAELIECITESYDRVGVENTLIVCRSNKRANRYNQGIRNQILWREEELCPGDLLMVVKNNYFWLKDFPQADFIANGDVVEIVRVANYIDLYDLRFAECTVKLVDYDLELDTILLLNSLHSDSASLGQEESKQFFYSVLEDYADLTPRKRQYDAVKENKYFNALQIKYANAITCHKAQGGQWKEVYIDAGYLTEDNLDIEYLRWLYTAITRATEKIYLVGFKDEYLS